MLFQQMSTREHETPLNESSHLQLQMESEKLRNGAFKARPYHSVAT